MSESSDCESFYSAYYSQSIGFDAYEKEYDAENTPLLIDHQSKDDAEGEEEKLFITETSHDEQIYRGPHVLIESHLIYRCFLRCLLLLWLGGGMAFLTCLYLCILVNMMYLAFHAAGSALIVAVGAFIAVAFAVGKFYVSVLRTFLRLSRFVWGRHFGFSRPTDSENSGKCMRFMKNSAILVFIVAGFGGPFWFVAIKYGYWTVVELLCAILTMSSAGTILLVNLFSRTARSLRFLWRMHRDYWRRGKNYSAKRLRANYLASIGFDNGRALVDQCLEYTISVCGIFMALSVAFQSPYIDPVVLLLALIVCPTIMGLSFLLRYRRQIFCCRWRILKNSRYHRHSKIGDRWLPLLFTAFMRILGFALAFVALMLYDCYQTFRGEKSAFFLNVLEEISKLWHETIYLQLLIAYMGALILRDIVFFFPLLPLKSIIRPLLLFILQAGQVFCAFFGKFSYPHSYLYFAAIFVSMNCIDYREARRFWYTKFEYKEANYRKKSGWVIWLPILLLIGSVFAGLIKSAVADYNVVGPSSRRQYNDSTVIDTGNHHYSPVLNNNANSNGALLARNFSAPICSLRFTPAQLSVQQLALMSLATYESAPGVTLEILGRDPELNSSWTLGVNSMIRCNYTHCTYGRDYPDDRPRRRSYETNQVMTSSVGFVEFINHGLNISVISIRGTYSFADVFEDLSMWSPVLFLQLSSYFGTWVRLWPANFVALVAYYITNYVGNPNLIYWQEMESIVEGIIRNRSLATNGDGIGGSLSTVKVILVGHSLGGGLAHIIATHLGLHSVAFSAPGLGYSIYNYNLNRSVLNDLTVNIVPLGDPVPMCDYQMGLIETIGCNASQPFACHHISRTVNTLYEMCQ